MGLDANRAILIGLFNTFKYEKITINKVLLAWFQNTDTNKATLLLHFLFISESIVLFFYEIMIRMFMKMHSLWFKMLFEWRIWAEKQEKDVYFLYNQKFVLFWFP